MLSSSPARKIATNLGSCDYLVIGAGAASLAFIDTLITELPDVQVVNVDKHSAPGGHWNDAYGFVHLHQPSLFYGVPSKQLEGNWLKLLLTKGLLPWQHRASKDELLAYYKDRVDAWIENGNVQYFPNCVYDFSNENKGGEHFFESLDKTESFQIRVTHKLVNGVKGEPIVPSTSPLNFKVDKDVVLLSPNELYDLYVKEQQEGRIQKWLSQFYLASSIFGSKTHPVANQCKKWAVLGGGKTAMDTVKVLQQDMGINPEDISWVVPHDPWMINRNHNGGGPWSYPQALIDNNMDKEKACAQLEESGAFVRIDKDVWPTTFRFPVIGPSELEYLQNLRPNIIRRGRVTSISSEKSGGVRVEFGPDQEPLSFSHAPTFIHCTSPGPFNGRDDLGGIFLSDKQMDLSFLFAPPVPISMSCLALLESRRRLGSLDIEFGRQILSESHSSEDTKKEDRLADKAISENDVLQHLFKGYEFLDSTDDNMREHLQPMKLLALIFAMIDKDPKVGLKWMQYNRLSFFSIPGFQSHVYENVDKMSKNAKSLGFDESEASLLHALAERIKPLEGK